MKPVIVGGAVDDTGGTLTAPDLDVNIEWRINERMAKHLVIRPTDQGETGQSLFKSVVIDIQNHGRSEMTKYVLE